MSKPKVLIVGCGAVGLSQGYHLSAGADITYLVRPGRTPAFSPPKRLYSYKDDELHTFSSYRVIESVTEVSGETFEFILDTLDGNTARSESGVATIRSLGDLMNEPQNADCFLVYDAGGLDMEDHYLRTLRIAPTRLCLVVSMLAHQRTSQIPIPASANKDLVAQADILYAHMSPNIGLMAANTRPALLKRLEAVYNSNGTLVISRLPTFIIPWMFPVLTLHIVTWNLDGFGPISRLRANNELWSLLGRAQSEILSLPRFGWTGWLLSFVLRAWAVQKVQESTMESVKPVNSAEFHAFHHGGKVAKQHARMLEDLLHEGEQVGRKLEGLREVVRRATKMHSS